MHTSTAPSPACRAYWPVKLQAGLARRRKKRIAAENARLAALLAYDILDTEADEELDALTRLASYITQTPIALVSLVDEHRQWFKAREGLATRQTPRSQAFCHYTIRQDSVLEVPDAHLDERFMNNPLVTGEPNMRYYCGVPLTTPQGYRLGSLCVIDHQPRRLDPAQLEALRTLAREVMARLELRSKQQELEAQKKQLVYSAEQYRALFEESQGFLFTHTPEGVILSVNRAVVNALGIAREALVGSNLTQLLGFKHGSLLTRYFKRIEAGVPLCGVTQVITARGEEQYWQYRNFATRNEKGEAYVICSAQDVTAKELAARNMRKAKEELEAEVSQRTRELQTANAALSQIKAELDLFLYRASHDLKGPLCSMEGLLNLVRMQEHPAEQGQYLVLMQQTIHKLNRVLESMVSYSNNTHKGVSSEPVNFATVLEKVLQSCRTLKGFDRVQLRTHLHTPVPFYSDAERVFTVLKNVISNGIVFQNSGLPQPTVMVWITTSVEGVMMVVRDNGIGIAEEMLSTLFQMFTKSSSQSAGSGLGLFVTGEIVKKLGGRISLQSQEGKGTQVSILMPLGKEDR